MPRVLAARARIATLVGVAMIVAGCLVLGYVAWQLWGTTIVARRDQERVVGEVERHWDRASAPASSEVRAVVAIVRIPAFGDDYAVPVRRGTGDDVLARGFGWFDQTAGPGEVGNFALAGHRVTHGEPLRRMPELSPGDRVVVETAERRYVYVLDTAGDALRIPFDQTWVLDDRPRNPSGGPQPPASADRLLTLTTCAEIFHTDDRLVAFGHLLDD